MEATTKSLRRWAACGFGMADELGVVTARAARPHIFADASHGEDEAAYSFGVTFRRDWPKATATDLDELLRRTSTAVRWAVEACNRELSLTEAKRDAANDAALTRLGKRIGAVVRTSGDPRGAVVTIGTRTAGPDDGVGVPSAYR